MKWSSWRTWTALGARIGEFFVPPVAAKALDKVADTLEEQEKERKAHEKDEKSVDESVK